jgi:hypothetical protein
MSKIPASLVGFERAFLVESSRIFFSKLVTAIFWGSATNQIHPLQKDMPALKVKRAGRNPAWEGARKWLSSVSEITLAFKMLA